jgi:hypothetical protein
MKKTLLAAIVGLLVAGSGYANTYSDNNPADVWLNALNPSYTGQFTLGSGYNPAAETITSAFAQFTFADPFGLSESLNVDLQGGQYFGSSGSFNTALVLSGAIVGNAWGILDSTGALSYTVSITSGGFTEFWLTNANLTVGTTTRGNGNSNSVPDAGATSLLLALGVIGIVGAKRRFASAV